MHHFYPIPTAQLILVSALVIRILLANSCTLVLYKGSHRMGDREIFLKVFAPHPLMMAYRFIPLSARSISLDSTFKDGKPHNSYSFMLNFVCRLYKLFNKSASNSSSFDTHFNFFREIFFKAHVSTFGEL
jgi:hypothetical protein